MKLALVGATGFVGTHLLKEALRRGHTVRAVVRDPQKVNIKEQNLTVEQGNALDVDELSSLIKGNDVLVSAYNSGWHNPNLYAEFLEGSRAIQQACKLAGVRRLIVVGGAGSLETKPGEQLVDSPDFPGEWKEGALAARDYLNALRLEKELDWVFVSPAIQMHAGTSGIRTGNYRTGNNQPVFNEDHESRISVEDFAVALLDEVKNAKFHQERFTVAW